MTKTAKEIAAERLAADLAADASADSAEQARVAQAAADNEAREARIAEDRQLDAAVNAPAAPAPAPEPPAPPPVDVPPPVEVPPPAPPPVEIPPPVPAPDPTPVPEGSTLREVFETVTQAHYGYKTIPEAELAALSLTPFPLGSYGPIPQDTSGTGESPHIGLFPGWGANDVIADDTRAEQYDDNVADLILRAPIHHTSKATGEMLLFADYPKASIKGGDPGSLDGINMDPGIPDANGKVLEMDLQHEPHFLDIPFMNAYRRRNVARARLLYREMCFLAIHNWLLMPYSGRGYHRGIFNTAMSICDLRGAGWGNATLDQVIAAGVLLSHIDPTYVPTEDKVWLQFVDSKQWNIKWLVETFIPGMPNFDSSMTLADGTVIDWNGPYYSFPRGALKNFLGIATNSNLYSQGPNDPYIRVGIFQQHFFTQSFQFAYGMFKAGYLPIDAQSGAYLKVAVDWLAGFAVRLCGDGKNDSIDFRRGAHQLSLAVATKGPSNANGDPIPIFFGTDKQINEANFASLAPLPDDNEIRYHDSNTILDFIQDGYAADIMPVLAFAMRDDPDRATPAWSRYIGSATFQRSRGHWPFGGANGIATKYAFGPKGFWIDDVTNVPAPGPAPAPAPGTSPIRLGKDFDEVPVNAGDLVGYGVDVNHVFVKRFAIAQTIVILPATFGIADPAVGVVKTAYLMPVGTQEGPTDGPAPPPIVIPPPAPGPSAPAPTPRSPSTLLMARSVSLNTMHDVDPCPQKGCPWSGLGLAEIMRVWCGGVWCPEYPPAGAFGIAGAGGHASYDGNEGYACPVDTFAWVMHGPPSPYSSADAIDGELPDGAPATRHLYMMIGYMPPAWGGGPKGSLLLFGAPGANNPAGAPPFPHRVHAVDLATGKWRRFADVPGGSFGNSYGGAVRDDARFGWWIVPSAGGSIYFVSKDGTVTERPAGQNSNGQSAPCLVGDTLLNLDYGLDWSTGKSYPKLQYITLADSTMNWKVCSMTGPLPEYRDGLIFQDGRLYNYRGTGNRDILFCDMPSDPDQPFEWKVGMIDGEPPVYESGNQNGHWRRLVPIGGGKLGWFESANAAVQVFE